MGYFTWGDDMRKSDGERKRQLIEQGHKQLQEHKWALACESFRRALQIGDEPAVRNNLAYALHQRGLLTEAIDVLRPVLDPGVVSPFGRALAAMICIELERKPDALAYLKQAIDQFEFFMRSPETVGFYPRAYWEYTVLIKRAAGLLGEHRLVIDLNRKWQSYYQTAEDLFQAGVAFFNENYPARAARVWARINEGGWQFLADYIAVAHYVEQGLIPCFSLPYLPPNFEGGADSKSSSDGRVKMLLLAQLFYPEVEDEFKEQAIIVLCRAAGEWGIEFGREILQGNSIPEAWKYAASRVLTERGVFKAGEPIHIVVAGETREIRLETKPIGFATAEQSADLEKIRELLLAGEYDKARQLLEKAFQEDDATIQSLELLSGSL